MIADYLNRRNPSKKLLARTESGLSLVEVLDRVDANGVAHFRFAVARTDSEGNALDGGGLILTASQWRELAELIGSVEFRDSCRFVDYQHERAPEEPATKRPLLW